MKSIAIGLLCLLFVGGCKARHVDLDSSVVVTDETREVLHQVCKQFLPEGELDFLQQDLCSCLEGERSDLGATFVKSLCEERQLARYFVGLKQMLIREGSEGFRTTQGNEPTDKDRQCANSLSDHYLEIYLSDLVDSCKNKKVSDAEFRSLISLPTSTDADQCWAFSRMTENACIVARPCAGSGSSKPGILPISEQSQAKIAERGEISEGESITLCQQNLRDIHKLKDPDNVNINYNLSYANLLAFARSAKHVTFAPANCHGTAQAVAGGILDEFVVSNITYHSPLVRDKCGARAEQIFGAAASLSGGRFPVAKDMPIERGGHLINMNHDSSCSASDCGDISFSISSCDLDSMVAHIFLNGMCINCWSEQLEKAGLRPLGPEQTWKDLIPGCVLTAADHSVSFLYANNGMCYYYESTSPYGPPQLRVDTCNRLYNKFGKRWCPVKPMAFDLE